MQITKNDLRNNLIMDFSYHDAKIIKVTKNEKDVIILLKDGFNEGQINELRFINCEIEYQFALENRIIYQLDDLVKFDKDKWNMSLLIWTNDNLLEKVYIEADNIISKQYGLKEGLLEEVNGYEDKLEEVEKLIGEITVEKIQNNKIQSFLNKTFKVLKKEKLLADFNNYVLVNEENLNKDVDKVLNN